MRDKFVLAEMRKQTKALEYIAKQLAKLANPPLMAIADDIEKFMNPLPGGVTYVHPLDRTRKVTNG